MNIEYSIFSSLELFKNSVGFVQGLVFLDYNTQKLQSGFRTKVQKRQSGFKTRSGFPVRRFKQKK